MNFFRRIVVPRLIGLACIAVVAMSIVAPPATAQSQSRYDPAQAEGANWQSPAQWRHGLMSKTKGTLVLTDTGVEFRPSKGEALAWQFEEIQTFKTTRDRFYLTGYQNRRWHFHGDRTFRFDLDAAVSPAAAATLTARVGKPNMNGSPNPGAPAYSTLGARHRTRGGGTNGTLRFRDSGIDYVTDSGKGARSWRWADIETIARRDPFHFRVGAYRETFEFELKQPMSRALFDRLWDQVYGRNLNGLSLNGGMQQ